MNSLATFVGGISIVLTALGLFVTKALRGLRNIGHLVDDLRGEPARPGQDARPGIMDRLAAVETATVRIQAEVTHNGGGSLKDAVARIERQQLDHLQMPHIDPTQHLLGRDR